MKTKTRPKTTVKGLAMPSVAPKSVLVKVKDVKEAEFNPAGRIEEKRKRKLRLSLLDVGLLSPLLMTVKGADGKHHLIDGHRRFNILTKEWGWTFVPAILVESEFEHTYGSLQSSIERLSSNDVLGIYLKNPRALIGAQRRKPELIERVCGRATVQYLYKMKLGYGVFDLAIRAWKFTDGTPEIKDVIRWLVRHNMTFNLRHMVDAGHLPKKTLTKAIHEDRPLSTRLIAE